MMHTLIYLTMMTMTLLFTQMKHPLSMGLMLLIQTLLICLMTGIMHSSFWFSYILFLVFLGGMLVLFIYVTSLASNEMFRFSTKLFLMNILLLSLSLIIILLIQDNMQFLLINNNEIQNFTFHLMNKENYLIINKLYNYPTNLTSLLLMNYLFFTLIATVKITNFYYGPLRMLY